MAIYFKAHPYLDNQLIIDNVQITGFAYSIQTYHN